MITQLKYTSHIRYTGKDLKCILNTGDEFTISRMCSDGTLIVLTNDTVMNIPVSIIQFCSRVTEDI